MSELFNLWNILGFMLLVVIAAVIYAVLSILKTKKMEYLGAQVLDEGTIPLGRKTSHLIIKENLDELMNKFTAVMQDNRTFKLPDGMEIPKTLTSLNDLYLFVRLTKEVCKQVGSEEPAIMHLTESSICILAFLHKNKGAEHKLTQKRDALIASNLQDKSGMIALLQSFFLSK